MSKGPAYRPEIDGLRAIAVGSVMLFHANHSWLPGGYVGVDIFFVISGYLITTIIYNELRDGSFTLARFYERRVRRILPALFFVILCCLPLAYALLTPGQLKDFGQSVLATAFFSSNIYFYLKTGYFAPDAEELPLLHTWSLAVEEQYYIIFPLIMMALMAWRQGWVRPLLWLMLVTSFVVSLRWGATNPMANFFLLPSRGWELLAGALLALYMPQVSALLDRQPMLRNVAEALGLAGILYGFLALTGDAVFPGWHAVPVVVGAVLLIGAMTDKSLVGRILSMRSFVAIGLISYSAYLWHQPLFAFARITQNETSTALLIGLLLLTFALAWVSWRFVERPFRDRHFLSQRQILAGGAVGIVIFGAIGAAGHVLRGFPDRFDAPTLALAATAAPSPRRSECHTDGIDYRPPANACIYGEPPAKWAVFGDSHVVELALALSERAQNGVRHLSFSGCPPALLFDPANPGCHEWTKESLSFLEADADTQNVVIIYRYPQHFGTGDMAIDVADTESKRSLQWQSLQAMVTRLQEAGKSVFVLAPVPELPRHAERYIFGSSDGAAQETTVSQSMAEYQTDMNATITQLGKLGATVLPVAPALCDNQQCFVIRDDTALYFDDNHLSLEGARQVIDGLIAQGALPMEPS